MNGGGRHHRNNIGGRRSSDQSPSAWPRPTNPTAVTNTNGGATLTDHQGHVQEGPRDDSVKKEGFLAKIKEKLQGPGKGRQHPSTPTTTAPAQTPEYWLTQIFVYSPSLARTMTPEDIEIHR